MDREHVRLGGDVADQDAAPAGVEAVARRLVGIPVSSPVSLGTFQQACFGREAHAAQGQTQASRGNDPARRGVAASRFARRVDQPRTLP